MHTRTSGWREILGRSLAPNQGNMQNRMTILTLLCNQSLPAAALSPLALLIGNDIEYHLSRVHYGIECL